MPVSSSDLIFILAIRWMRIQVVIGLIDEGTKVVVKGVYLKVRLTFVLNTFGDQIFVLLKLGSLNLILQHLLKVVMLALRHQEIEYMVKEDREALRSYYNVCKYPIQIGQMGLRFDDLLYTNLYEVGLGDLPCNEP
jgi:DNA integrity scanning protein DisA with diadenylate cyclase activity